jgi:hypothetical protein
MKRGVEPTVRARPINRTPIKVETRLCMTCNTPFESIGALCCSGACANKQRRLGLIRRAKEQGHWQNFKEIPFKGLKHFIKLNINYKTETYTPATREKEHER